MREGGGEHMFYGYPRRSTDANLVHECFVHVVLLAHDCADQGQHLPVWRECLPDRCRGNEKWERKTGPYSKLKQYFDALTELAPDEREAVRRAVEAQRDFDGFLSAEGDCVVLEALPEGIRQVARNLADCFFNVLGDEDVRDTAYQMIWDELRGAGHALPVCPFCNIEPLRPPRGVGGRDRRTRRPELDHYLPRSLYPFAAANLLNLPPMGDDCNTRKREKDILRTGKNGRLRRVFHPYEQRQLIVDFNQSVPFEGECSFGLAKPRWEISFRAQGLDVSDEVASWDSIFDVRYRYSCEILDLCYESWLQSMVDWICAEFFSMAEVQVPEVVQSYRERIVLHDRLVDRETLRKPFFEWVEVCVRGHQRFRDHIWAMIVASRQRLSSIERLLEPLALPSAGQS